jgi:hypothetical protein
MRRATSASLSRIDRREASVGCAVNTGYSCTLLTAAATSFGVKPSSTRRETVSAIRLDRVVRFSARSSMRWTCSAVFASKGGVELIEIVGHDPNLPKSGGSLTV